MDRLSWEKQQPRVLRNEIWINMVNEILIHVLSIRGASVLKLLSSQMCTG